MPKTCLVVGCHSFAGKGGKKLYRFPTVRKWEGKDVEEMTERRLRLWLKALNRKDIDIRNIKSHHSVCCDHFVTGKPAYYHNQTHPDWIPNRNIGNIYEKPKQMEMYTRTQRRSKQKLDIYNATTEHHNCYIKPASSHSNETNGEAVSYDLATRFMLLLSKSLQSICQSSIDFATDVEIAGHVFLKIDKKNRFDYVLNEKLSKTDENSYAVLSKSFHIQPLQMPAELPENINGQSTISDLDIALNKSTGINVYEYETQSLSGFKMVAPANSLTQPGLTDQLLKIQSGSSELYGINPLTVSNHNNPQKSVRPDYINSLLDGTLLSQAFTVKSEEFQILPVALTSLSEDQCLLSQSPDDQSISCVENVKQECGASGSELERDQIIQSGVSVLVHDTSSEVLGVVKDKAQPRDFLDVETTLRPVSEQALTMSELSTCPYCCSSFSNGYVLCQHLKMYHCINILPQERDDKEEDRMELQCTSKFYFEKDANCDKVQNESSKVTSPTRENAGILVTYSNPQNVGHTNEIVHGCDVCAVNFSHSDLLSMHQKSHSKVKPYKCKDCGRGFAKNYLLMRHSKTHRGEKPIACDICGLRFNFLCILKKHMRVHTREKPHKCNACGKCFGQKNTLMIHKVLHMARKPYKCGMCDQAFNHKNSLRLHKWQHSEVKPYHCETCGCGFASRTRLRDHQLSHTRERSHLCDTCGKAFILPEALRRHKRTHTGEKPFACDTCAMRFSQNSSLKTHRRIHTGEKPFSCDVCPAKFAQRASYLKHKYTHTRRKE